jgi:hypothetical protein
MPLTQLPVRTFVVEWRFAPNLLFYSKMDEVGLHFVELYPDWKRTALALEIRSTKHRRRVFMSYRRAFFEVIDPADNDLSAELERAFKVFDRLSSVLGISRLERLGIRHFAAFPKEAEFASLVARFRRKFHAASTLDPILAGNASDAGFSVIVKMPQGWQYQLTAGPMERSQWFDIVPSDPELFSGPEEFLKYRDDFTKRFLYLDIDCSKTDVVKSDLLTLPKEMVSTTQTVLLGLDNYFEAK